MIPLVSVAGPRSWQNERHRMALGSGMRLGPYEILAPLGAGGMGEVYRAHDTRLERLVAVKVLPENVAADPDRLARFEREAKGVAALSHPNILAIHEFGRADGVAYAVTELLEGDTLRARLDGAPLPSRKALDVVAQIARGLAAAHDKGIVHRDLKPENVFLTRDGHVKILDFGLAKQITPAAGDSTQLATEPGLVLGTVGYMAPEQVRGHAVDGRADLFACGAVLYEMLAGRRAFHGDTAAETMVAIVKSEPPPLAPRADISPALERVISHAMEKAPGDRFQSARDLAFALESLRDANPSGVRPAMEPGARRWRVREVTAWMLAAALAAATAALLLRDRNAPVPIGLVNLTLDDEADLSSTAIQAVGFVVSPDGTRVFSQAARGDRRLFVRQLDQPNSVSLPNTELGRVLFVSSDGQWLGFATASVINRLSLVDGTVFRVSEAPTIATSAALSADGRIVFSMGTNLWQVPATGGTPAPLTTLASDEESQTVGGFLPDGRTLLFTNWRSGRPRIEALNVVNNERRVVVEQASGGQYVSTGHLLFAREDALLAAPFDAEAMSIGTAARVLDRIRIGMLGVPKLGASRDGRVVVYAEPARSSLVWVMRSGRETALDLPPRQYQNVRIAADGRRIAFVDESAVWVADLIRSGTTRVSSERFLYGSLDWSPDDSQVAYSALNTLVTRAVDGTGSPRQVAATLPVWKLAPSLSRDGKTVAYTAYFGPTNADIYVEPLDGSSPPKAFVATPAYDAGPQFSPDSRYLAYTSTESGRLEVYVTPFPGPGPKLQVSTNGGTHVRWNRDGSELFYRNGDDMMAVPVTTKPAFNVGKPMLLFSGRYSYISGLGLATYDVGPDGRFLMIKSDERAERPHVLLDWSRSLPQLQNRQ